MGDCTASRLNSSSTSGFPQYTPDFEWRFYKSLVENYFALKSVKDQKLQKELFIAQLPEELINVVIGVMGLEGLSTATMQDMFQQLDSYFQTKVPVAVHRCSFFRRDRRDNETLTIYAMALKGMAELCDFGDSTSENLCILFKAGLNQWRVQKLLADFKTDNFDALLRRATLLELIIVEDASSGGDGTKLIKDEPAEVSACDFKEMGCDFKGSVSERARHLVSASAVHMLLINNSVQQNPKAQDQPSSGQRQKFEQDVELLKKKCEAQSQEIDILRQKGEAQNKEIVILTQQFDKNKQQNEEVIGQLRGHAQKFDAQKASIDAYELKCNILQEDILTLKGNAGNPGAAHIQKLIDDSQHTVSNNTFFTAQPGTLNLKPRIFMVAEEFMVGETRLLPGILLMESKTPADGFSKQNTKKKRQNMRVRIMNSNDPVFLVPGMDFLHEMVYDDVKILIGIRDCLSRKQLYTDNERWVYIQGLKVGDVVNVRVYPEDKDSLYPGIIKTVFPVFGMSWQDEYGLNYLVELKDGGEFDRKGNKLPRGLNVSAERFKPPLGNERFVKASTAAKGTKDHEFGKVVFNQKNFW